MCLGVKDAWEVSKRVWMSGGYDVGRASGMGTCALGVGHRIYRLLLVSNTMSGPVASNLVLLTDVKDCEPGKKVRFLGW